jgi:glycosyltransferase involved in cell wall biosynthesis
MGYMPNEAVLAFYAHNPVDLFINVSASEGIPVSIMEAQNLAIPVLASAVGGIPEIVTAQNGELLAPDPSPAEIAEAIARLRQKPALLKQKRALSQKDCHQKFDADKNYQAFAARLRSMIDGGMPEAV